MGIATWIAVYSAVSTSATALRKKRRKEEEEYQERNVMCIDNSDNFDESDVYWGNCHCFECKRYNNHYCDEFDCVQEPANKCIEEEYFIGRNEK